VWPAILTAGALSLANLTLLALTAAGLVRLLPHLVSRVVVQAPESGLTDPASPAAGRGP
jgi:hypothetical protein